MTAETETHEASPAELAAKVLDNLTEAATLETRIHDLMPRLSEILTLTPSDSALERLALFLTELRRLRDERGYRGRNWVHGLSTGLSERLDELIKRAEETCYKMVDAGSVSHAFPYFPGRYMDAEIMADELPRTELGRLLRSYIDHRALPLPADAWGRQHVLIVEVEHNGQWFIDGAATVDRCKARAERLERERAEREAKEAAAREADEAAARAAAAQKRAVFLAALSDPETAAEARRILQGVENQQ